MGNESIDIFEREQIIYDDAVSLINHLSQDEVMPVEAFAALTKEYGKILKQLRRATKISDRATENLNSSKLELQDRVHYDTLTGIYSRRYLEETLKSDLQAAAQNGGLFSVMMLDVDFFKKYNDTYGHSDGDNCLRRVAKAVAESLTRADDFVARYGGEEFVVVLPNTDESSARVIANRILENVRALRIPHANNAAAPYVTLSIGLTTTTVEKTHTGADYIKRADEALYASKQSGKNRYTFFAF